MPSSRHTSLDRPLAANDTPVVPRSAAFRALAELDRLLVDDLAIALAAHTDDGKLTLQLWPAPGNHGQAAVSWTQDGRNRTEEGHGPAEALRFALAAAGRVSAHPRRSGRGR